MLDSALRYLKNGFSVIPLEPRGKKPLIKWEEFQSRRATENEVTQWFLKNPNANVGIVTGQISQIVVMDLDGPKGIQAAEKLGVKSNVVVLTGDGKHLYYKWQNEIKNSASQIAEGIDIRGDGGFVVVPPSVHPTGRRYRFMGIASLALPNTPFPAYLLATDVSLSNGNKPVNSKSETWLDEALEDFKNGHIANTLVSILGKFRAHNFTETATFNFLTPHNTSGKLSEQELRDKISEIWGRYEPSSARVSVQSPGFMEPGLCIKSPTNENDFKQFRDRQSAVKEDDRLVLRSGYAKLDQMLVGGLKSSRLFTLAARTGVGKSNWLIGAAKEICRAGKSVLLFSTEMPYEEIWSRYIPLLKSHEEFRQHKFYVCDSFAPHLEKVEEAINQIRPDVFMFDHINHVAEDPRELGTFMQGLNFIRRKYENAGIVSAQLNRQADWVDLKTGEKVTPRMSMIKGSGTIEQASSRVLLLSEKRVTPDCTEIIGNLDKNDNGPKGLLHFGLFTNPWRIEELP